MPKGKFIIGNETKNQSERERYTDQELNYVNKGFVLEFFHVPSGKVVQFKAMLTDFKDKYESSWNQEMVYGRNDPIQNFQGTKRTITLAWDLVAASWGEAKDNLQRATLLNSMLYPSYAGSDGVSTISAAPLFKLSFANLIRNYGAAGDDNNAFKNQNIIKRSDKSGNVTTQAQGKASGLGVAEISGLVGSISGFTYAPVLENGMFDPAEDPGQLYPQTINLSCEFTVMHTHRLGWQKGSKGVDFRAPNFPYGRPVRNIQQTDGKQVMRESTRNAGTDAHRSAASKRTLGSK